MKVRFLLPIASRSHQLDGPIGRVELMYVDKYMTVLPEMKSVLMVQQQVVYPSYIVPSVFDTPPSKNSIDVEVWCDDKVYRLHHPVVTEEMVDANLETWIKAHEVTGWKRYAKEVE